MGEAARRRQQGFDGRRMGEAVLAALNGDAGGVVWALAKGGSMPNDFIVLDAESTDVRTEHITNRQAASTPHRVVGLVLVRRGEPWIEAMVFDPCETYRPDLYTELVANAVRLADGLMQGERVEEARIEIVSSAWPESVVRKTLESSGPAAERSP